MRRLTKTTATLAIVAGVAIGANAQDKSVRLDPVSRDLYRLTYLNEGPSHVKVEVLDSQGIVLHTEQLKQSKSFTKPYNFSQLPDGEYSFKVTDTMGEYVAKINRTEDVHMVATIEEVDRNKAKVIVRGDFMSPVIVNIYDKKSGLIFDDFIDHEKSFSKVYDLSKVKVNDLKIEVTTGKRLLAIAEFK